MKGYVLRTKSTVLTASFLSVMKIVKRVYTFIFVYAYVAVCETKVNQKGYNLLTKHTKY